MGPDPDGIVAVKAARLIDATGAPPIETGVVVRVRRIENRGPAASTAIPMGARSFSLTATP